MNYFNIDKKIKTPQGHEIEIATEQGRGFWTRASGSEGGGLWFSVNEKGILVIDDYDGAFDLPAAVWDALSDAGFDITYRAD